nr:hypothetical protein [Novosphingobium mathurense]
MFKLEQAIVRLAIGHGAFKEMNELHPGLRMVHCEHHFIFCLPREAEPALIVAIPVAQSSCHTWVSQSKMQMPDIDNSSSRRQRLSSFDQYGVSRSSGEVRCVRSE